jgi:ketosteroid isomerase-like protein
MPTPAHDLASIREAMDETNRRFMDGFRRGDPAGASEATYTRDARVLAPDVPMQQGRDAIAQFWVGAVQQLGVTSVELTTVEVQSLGEGAYEIGRATLNLGGGQQAHAKYVVIWRQEDGQWRWHVDIWNMEPA